MNIRVNAFRGLRAAISLVIVMSLATQHSMLPVAAATAKCKVEAPSKPNKVSVRRGSKAVQIVTPKTVPSAEPSDLELMQTRVFYEPLIPMKGSALSGENAALSKAIASASLKSDKEDLSDFQIFLQNYPKSRWAPSLQDNLGDRSFEYGYLSNAIKYWQLAWNSSKSAKTAPQKAVADYAVSNLLQIESRLGRITEIENLLNETKLRGFRGSDEERVEAVKQAIWTLKNEPGRSFKCGPFALSALAEAAGDKKSEELNKLVLAYQSSPKGTNLLELKQLAQKIGLNVQAAKRSAGAPVLYPAVLHWNVGHFAAITGLNKNRYRLNDKTFGTNSSFSISLKGLELETDGYFLVASGPLPSGWAPVSDAEAATIWGKGYNQNRNEKPKYPKNAPSKSPSPGSCGGMAQAKIYTMNATPFIFDTPLSYSPPVGPRMDFTINWNYLETDQPSTFAFTNFGQDWSFNWLSYLTVDASNNVTLRRRGGGVMAFAYTAPPDNVTSPYAQDLLTQATIVPVDIGVWNLLFPDGTVEVFNQGDGTGRIFLTKVIDPQGNSVSIQYDTNFRVTSVTDAIGQTSTFTYVSNIFGAPGFYQISLISDPFSRTASFFYDSTNSYLVSNTDVIGLKSQYLSDPSSSFISALTTPYGTTSFYQYTLTGTNPPRGLRVNNPDGTMVVLENWVNGLGVTYYWDREATAAYPSDPAKQVYTHCEATWFTSQTDELESPCPSEIIPALEAGTIYNYPVEPNSRIAPNSIGRPSLTQVQTPYVRSYLLQWVGSVVNAGDVVGVTVNNQRLTNNSLTVTYTCVAGDTLASIAANLTNLINQNNTLSGLGIRASNAPGTAFIYMLANSALITTYGAYTAVGSEGMYVNANANRIQDVAVGGTITAGDVLTMNIYDAGLPGGVQSVSHTVTAGDTTGTINSALKNAVTSNANLRSARIAAVVIGGYLELNFSNSPNPTSASLGTSAGATETLTLINNQNFPWFGGFQGPLVPGIVVTYTVQDPGLSGGNKHYAHTIVAGDTWTNIAAWAAASINADPAMQQLGISAFTGGELNIYNDPGWAVLWLVSTSPNNTTSLYPTLSGGSNPWIATQPTNYAYQTWKFQYNDFGKVTQSIDPINRTFNYFYAANNIDLLEKRETAYGDNYLLGKWEYGNGKHLPTLYIDGSGQQTQYSYNGYGEIQSVTDANSNVTTFTYNTNGYLTQITQPLSGNQAVTNFSYDGYGRLYTVTDSEGYVTTYSYDAANRITQIAYPDSTTEQYVYDRLDQALVKDRLNRWTSRRYDSLDQLISETDPLGRTTNYAWCACGSLSSLTDPLGRVTSWQHDLEGRVTSKTYPDGSQTQYVWDPSVPRIVAKIDATNQITNYVYQQDSSLSLISFVNATNPQVPIAISWDPNFNRRLGVGNGWGAITDVFNAYITDPFATATTGGGKLRSEQNTTVANSAITFSYDALGRLTNRSINGSANSDTWTYDNINRVLAETNPSGGWTYNYLDNVSGASKGSSRLSSIVYPNGQTANFNWINPAQSQWLASITNLTSAGATLSQFNYSYDNAGEIRQWGQIQNNSSQLNSFGYDAAGQLIASQANAGSPSGSLLSQDFYSYDAASNRTSVQQSTVKKALIGGPVTAGNVLTITASDPALPGGSESVSYTVASGDTLGSIATKLAASITADGKMQAAGINAVANGSVVAIQSTSRNLTNYSQSVSGTETVTLGYTGNFVQLATVGGTKTTGDILSLVVRDPALVGGTKTVNYTVSSTDSLATIASGLKNAINADASLTVLGVTATVAGTTVAIKSTSTNATVYSASIPTSATETLSLSVDQNGGTTFGIGGTQTTGDVITLNVYDSGLSGGKESVSYTVAAGDTLSSIAANLAAAINADTKVQGIGVSASASGTTIVVTSNSLNGTTYRTGLSTAATESFNAGLPANGIQTLAVGGVPRTNDVISVSVYDAGLSGGYKTDTYTVVSGDTLTSIAAGVASAINADSALSTLGITASSTFSVVNIQSVSQNLTTYRATVITPGGTEALTLAPGSIVISSAYNNLNELIAMGGGGAERFQGLTNKPIASATVGTPTVWITSSSTNATTYTTAVIGPESLTAGNNLNGNQTITVGGGVAAGDALTITVQNTSLSGGQESVNYTVLSTDTPVSIAAGLASAINADTALQAIGVSANSAYPMALSWSQSFSGNATLAPGLLNATVSAMDGGSNTATNVYAVNSAATSYSEAVTGTETITFSGNINGNTTATVGGIATAGDVLQLVVYNPAIPNGSETLSYTVTSGDTLLTIATAITNAVNADSTLQAAGISSTVSSTVISLNSAGGTGRVLSYDANGNLISDGVNTYSWDPLNQLIQITYPGTNNYTNFNYDGFGRQVKIVETTNGSITNTRQIIWCRDERCEERDGSGVLKKQFFDYGQRNNIDTTAVSYFYSKDHLGSIREMTNSSGTVQAQYSFDPFGVKSIISETSPADFQYAGYYVHSRSGLNLTATRPYSAGLGRFISRDPIEEEGGLNLFSYVENDPIRFSDPSGLRGGGPLLPVPDPEQPVGGGACPKKKPKKPEPAKPKPPEPAKPQPGKPSADAPCTRCVGDHVGTDPNTGKAIPPDPEGAKKDNVVPNSPLNQLF